MLRSLTSRSAIRPFLYSQASFSGKPCLGVSLIEFRRPSLRRRVHAMSMNEENGDGGVVVQQRRSARIKKLATPTATLVEENDSKDDVQHDVKRKRGMSFMNEDTDSSELSSLDETDENDFDSGSPKPKTRKASKTKASQKGKRVKLDDDPAAGSISFYDILKYKGDEAYEPESPSKKKKTRKPREPKPEPVYVIPDVVRRETKFRGRLGYACLNTVLRNKKPAANAVFCSRTCRIDSIIKNGIEWVKELGRKNVQDLMTMIQWNEDNNISFLRVSSEMFPFASHGTYGYSLEYCASELAEAGALAKRYGHRLTSHPGQFTQLGSPKPGVIESSVRELKYHCEMMDLMGLGKDSVLVIHGGGVYDDKPATIKRIKSTIREMLPQDVRARLVLENDELCYNAEDLLPICEELDVPLVFDYHHDALNPSSIPPSEIIKRANAIFHRRGIKPKQHLSEPRPGAVTLMERRAHADRCEKLPEELDMEDVAMDVDLMIEAKDKEQAVLQLYRVYALKEVKHESLRPPDENQTKETKGRKSSKKAKGKKGKGADVEEEEDVEAMGSKELAGDEDVRAVEDEDHDHGAIVTESQDQNLL